MMFYALKKNKIAFDYATLGQIKEGVASVSLSYDTRIALLEGDEFRTSPLEKKPVHQFYHPQIVLLTNLKWEECDEFLTFESYLSSFKKLVEGIARDGKYIYYEGDLPLQSLTSKIREDITEMPYKAHDIIEDENGTLLKTRFGNFPIKIMDDYFLQNLNGARLACRQLGLPDKEFYVAISEFSMINN
jgi:UDP-N-acetylmuramate: L-alanyl-gamma-D-glutamyl-meso-diaminopimelate ligase